MRPQTKRMQNLLTEHGSVNDAQATRAGIKNPRREAGLLLKREGMDIRIIQQSDTKREYRLVQ